MTKEISGGRKTAYYIGGAMTLIGVFLFGLPFLLALLHFDNFQSYVKVGMAWGFGGFALTVIGSIVMNIGARGAAGSGLVLDPKKAREDLEPFTRQAGGMVKDALDEADIHLGGKSEKVIMIKCKKCSKLNEEDSKFCQECGEPL
jgi:hypothetical protein